MSFWCLVGEQHTPGDVISVTPPAALRLSGWFEQPGCSIFQSMSSCLIRCFLCWERSTVRWHSCIYSTIQSCRGLGGGASLLLLLEEWVRSTLWWTPASMSSCTATTVWPLQGHVSRSICGGKNTWLLSSWFSLCWCLSISLSITSWKSVTTKFPFSSILSGSMACFSLSSSPISGSKLI